MYYYFKLCKLELTYIVQYQTAFTEVAKSLKGWGGYERTEKNDDCGVSQIYKIRLFLA